MSKSSDQRVEEILQRARANRRQRVEEEGEAEQHRARVRELDKAFTAVRDFKPNPLCGNQGPTSTTDESAEAYAECILSLGRELAAKVDLLSTPPDKLADQGNEAKTIALAILGAGMQGEKAKVIQLLQDVMDAGDILSRPVSDWLTTGLENEIMGYQTLVDQGDDGKGRPVRQAWEKDEQWRSTLAGMGQAAGADQNQGQAEQGERTGEPRDQGRSRLTGVKPRSLNELSAAAQQVWESDPVRAFGLLRDGVRNAIHHVAEVYRQAAAAPETSLTDLAIEHHEPLLRAICDAQALWFDTPIRQYLDCPEGPVYLDRLARRATGRLSGSCHHDLALGIAVGLKTSIEQRIAAANYVRQMRFHAFVGDHIAERLTELMAEVACESQTGVARWKTDIEERRKPLSGPSVPPEQLDESRCPGCQRQVSADERLQSLVPCAGCGKWELHTGIIVTPVAGPPGTAPEPICVSQPFWSRCRARYEGSGQRERIPAAHLDPAATPGGTLSEVEQSVQHVSPQPSPHVQAEESAETRQTIRMTVLEANKKALALAKRLGKVFFALSEREQAKQIGCSWQTWSNTPLYKLRKKAKQKAERKRVATQRESAGPRPAVSLTDAVEATSGEGGKDAVLQGLIAEETTAQAKRSWEDLSPREQEALLDDQERDFERSPLEPDPTGARPEGLRYRKQY